MVDLTREQIDRAEHRWHDSDYLTESEATALFAVARALLDERETRARDVECGALRVALECATADLATARREAAASEEAARLYAERGLQWERELGECRAQLKEAEALLSQHDNPTCSGEDLSDEMRNYREKWGGSHD